VSCLVLALAIVATLVRDYFRCWHSDGIALAASLPDDSFYSLLPAWRIWQTGQLTFDGIHQAYGFQPLWELVVVALAGVSSSKDEFLRLVLFTSSVLLVGAALVAGDLVRVLTRQSSNCSIAGALASAALLLNAQLHWVATSGKETALYLVLLASALRLTLVPPGMVMSESRAACVGLLWSLVPLSRLTPASIILAVLGYKWLGVRGRPASTVLVWMTVPVLWAGGAWWMFGHVWPTSGLLKTEAFVDAASSGRILTDLPAIIPTLPPYFLEVARFSAGFPSRFVAVAPPSGTLLVVTASIVAASLGFIMRPRLSNRRIGLASVSGIACVAIVPFVLYYGTGNLYYVGTWYHTELPLLLAMAIGLGLSVWSKRLAALAVGLMFFPMAQGLLGAPRHALAPLQPNPQNLQHVIAETAGYLNARPDIQQLRIASWNAGLLGFLVETTVINLDGLANDDIVRFSSAGGSVADYLRRERVQLVVDAHPRGAPLQLGPLRLAVIHVTPWVGDAGSKPGWFVMQLHQD
jgi:hypothetical protein